MDIIRGLNADSIHTPIRGEAFPEFHGSLDFHRLDPSDTLNLLQFFDRRPGQARQVAEFFQNLLRQSVRIQFLRSRTEQDGQKFCVLQRIRAKTYQPFPRALLFGDVTHGKTVFRSRVVHFAFHGLFEE
ncbi:MAG: hypothetical protein BWX80_04204 [Candidatus Hydrogenedentes bacterium ADurb.Bin101]|nr:MAG: hypothetical protein BWX80_04204 [Candidatus Hydrogenedentes bacterium ADurb.Bin101]